MFDLNGDSASGTDGFSGTFFQNCWDIIEEDIFRMLAAFFSGKIIPKFITHTNFILLPKKEQVRHMTDLRPINLCTFVRKIISRVVDERIANVLPIIISINQTGFIKGRNITENVLLA